MALPSRLIPITRSLSKVSRVISPTGIGVLLSVGAHAALLLFGPRTDFSFAALSQAAQQAEAEEAIVPLVQLSPAERNRLPSFAQPRRQLQPPTGLGNLALPSGLPSVPNTSIPRPRTTVPANPFPAATLPQQARRVTPQPTFSRSRPAAITNRPLPRRPSILPNLGISRPPAVTALPARPAQAPPPPTSVTPTPVPSAPPQGSASDLPELEPAGVEPGLSIEEALNQSGSGNGDNSGSNNGSGSNSGDVALVPDIADELPGEGATGAGESIPVEPPQIALAPAQGDTALLIDGNNNYDPTAVSEEDALTREEEWLVATAEGKESVGTETSELTINSEFKACREEPPVDGRLGIVVNPDGSRSEPAVLKSIGYDVLNRLAIRTLEYEDFGTPGVPTQYTVDVKVIYEPEDCAGLTPADAVPEEGLPELPAE